MTTAEWFAGVFDRALGRWVSNDPDGAEAIVSGLIDKLMNLNVFWTAIGNWLDANPDKVEPFVVSFLNNTAANAQTPADPTVP